jgi:hypothetical protein
VSACESDLYSLIDAGDVRACAGCGEYSAHSWDHVTSKSDTGRPERGEIGHIGASSCFEWQCGHCSAYNAFKDAPILAECYTHVEPPDCDNLPAHARCSKR